MKDFSVKGKVEVFPQKGGWVYVRVPKTYTTMFAEAADRGKVSFRLRNL